MQLEHKVCKVDLEMSQCSYNEAKVQRKTRWWGSSSIPVRCHDVKASITALRPFKWLLKYQFCKNVTSEKWNSDGLNTFGHICLHFWAWLLLYSAITPKSEDKYVQKCSTRQSFIFPKWHSYKIGTLDGELTQLLTLPSTFERGQVSKRLEHLSRILM